MGSWSAAEVCVLRVTVDSEVGDLQDVDELARLGGLQAEQSSRGGYEDLWFNRRGPCPYLCTFFEALRPVEQTVSGLTGRAALVRGPVPFGTAGSR